MNHAAAAGKQSGHALGRLSDSDRLRLHAGAGAVPLSPMTLIQALECTNELLHAQGHHFFCFCEASLLSNVARDPAVAAAVQRADAVFADGIAMVILARLAGTRLPERIPGPSFLLAASEYGVSRGWRHFCFGGEAGVADALAANLRAKYAGIQIVGTYSPPFRALTSEEELAVKQTIEACQPHFLWVCLGSPKQELWVADHVGKINVPLMLPVGAAFDFHAGHRPWAPAWVRRMGLEWLFRMFTGGRRTFTRNIRCVSIVAWLIAKAAFRRLSP